MFSTNPEGTVNQSCHLDGKRLKELGRIISGQFIHAPLDILRKNFDLTVICVVCLYDFSFAKPDLSSNSVILLETVCVSGGK